MADQVMPNVAGKGPSLIREMLATIKEMDGGLSQLSDGAAEKVRVVCEKAMEMESLVTRAYMKTVKAGEVSWQCSQMALQVKDSIASGSEAQAVETAEKLDAQLGELINKTKNFVVRMT